MTLAKTVSKRGYVGLITQVLDSLHVYVFGELLNALENVPEEYRQYRELYLVFTYGTYLEYRAKRDELPELSEKQMKKLKKLSIVHVVNRCSSKVVPYDQLLKALDCNDVAEMEALVMSCMYSVRVCFKMVDIYIMWIETVNWYIESTGTKLEGSLGDGSGCSGIRDGIDHSKVAGLVYISRRSDLFHPSKCSVSVFFSE